MEKDFTFNENTFKNFIQKTSVSYKTSKAGPKQKRAKKFWNSIVCDFCIVVESSGIECSVDDATPFQKYAFSNIFERFVNESWFFFGVLAGRSAASTRRTGSSVANQDAPLLLRNGQRFFAPSVLKGSVFKCSYCPLKTMTGLNSEQATLTIDVFERVLRKVCCIAY